MLNNKKVERINNIYLYGYNNISLETYRELLINGFNVKAIIDKNKKLHQRCNDVRVIGLETLDVNADNDICIVCLNNGLIHDDIAKELNMYGFEWILFLPMKMYYSISSQSKYRIAYKMFFEGDFDKVVIPQYVPSDAETSFVIIDEDKTSVTFWCPRKLLRTGTRQQYEKCISDRKLKNADGLLKYCDVEIDDFKPYIYLFKTLGDKGNFDCLEYLQLQRDTYFEQMKLLEDRKVLFEIFEQHYKYDMAFFTESPIKTIWNNKGWLNIIDGLHRVFYLNYKGYDLFPVVLSKDDYKSCKMYYK